jgi:uncharacterized protein
MGEIIYRPWYFARPVLAGKYFDMLLGGHGDPLALFAPRRVGKTSFLLNELASEAGKRGFVPIYIDVWQNRGDALSAINYALQESLDDLSVPANVAARRLKTSVKKVGIGGASLELGDEPTRRRPDEPALLIDWLLKSLIRTAPKPILLMFDKVQELAQVPGGEIAVSSLRAAITKSRDSVRVIFTGSSQEQLLELFSRSRAALYEGASLLQFPLLNREFTEFIVARAKLRYRKTIAVEKLYAAFERLHFQPRALLDLIFVYCTSDREDLAAILDDQWEALLDSSDFHSLWQGLKPLQQKICRRVALGQEFSSQTARLEYAVGAGRKGREVSPGTISSAIRQLKKLHLLARAQPGRGTYIIEDPLFAEWIRRTKVTDANRSGTG